MARPKAQAVSFRRADRATIERKTKTVRRTTVYFQVDTAAALAEYLHSRDEDMSKVVDEAVRLFLEKQRSPRPRGRRP